MALLPTWLGLFGAWHWMLDLFTHFRWQYLIVSFMVLVIATWRRQRGVIALAAMALLLNGYLIGRLAWHPGSAGAAVAGAPQLSVLSLNVHRVNPQRMGVLDYVVAADADVVLLMEVDEGWMNVLLPLAEKYPHRLAEPRPDNFGMALFSRVPLEDARLMWLGPAQVPSATARINLGGRELLFVGTHPVPPISAATTQARDEQLALLAAYASASGLPVLLAGDLNTTPWSAGMRALRDARLGSCGGAAPWKPTWRARSAFAIPIDQALCTAPLVITRRVVGPDVGSDHRPLHVVAGWSP